MGDQMIVVVNWFEEIERRMAELNIQYPILNIQN